MTRACTGSAQRPSERSYSTGDPTSPASLSGRGICEKSLIATLWLRYVGSMIDTTTPDTIERTTVLPHPLERVWAALTDPAEFSRWFCDHADWELREGAPMTMRWEEHGTAPGVIVAVEPMSRFAYRWGSEDQPLDAARSTLVEWTLAPTGDGGTRLTVLESGFSTLVDGATQREGNVDGWRFQFENIARHLDGG